MLVVCGMSYVIRAATAGGGGSVEFDGSDESSLRRPWRWLLSANSTTTTEIPPEGPATHQLTEAQVITYSIVCVSLVTFAGICSGLQVALFSIDVMHMRVVASDANETATNRSRAGRIHWLLQKAHFALVALLIANAGSMTALPLFLEKLVSELIAVIISVTAVLIFGEIVPQAIFIRHNFFICAMGVPFVTFLMGVTAIVSYPVSFLLDLIVGRRETFVGREDLPGYILGSEPTGITQLELGVIVGAMKMREYKLADVALLKVEDAYMLRGDAAVDAEAVGQLLTWGKSRVPLYVGSKHNVIGVLDVGSLLQFMADRIVAPPPSITSSDPSERGSAATLSTSQHDLPSDFFTADATVAGGGSQPRVLLLKFLKPLPHVMDSQTLLDVYPVLKKRDPGMCAVYRATQQQNLLVGFLTLTDVIECIHQHANGVTAATAGHHPIHLAGGGMVDALEGGSLVGPRRATQIARAVEIVKAEMSMRVQTDQ